MMGTVIRLIRDRSRERERARERERERVEISMTTYHFEAEPVVNSLGEFWKGGVGGFAIVLAD
jgi:hypothetical protein